MSSPVTFEVEGGFMPETSNLRQLTEAAQRELDARSRVTVETAMGTQHVEPGSILESSTGRPYIVDRLVNQRVVDSRGNQVKNDHGEPCTRQALTLRRALPKVKGKAARKAAKRARRHS